MAVLIAKLMIRHEIIYGKVLDTPKFQPDPVVLKLRDAMEFWGSTMFQHELRPHFYRFLLTRICYFAEIKPKFTTEESELIETDETSMKFKLLFCVMDSGKPGKIMHSSVRVLQSGDLLRPVAGER